MKSGCSRFWLGIHLSVAVLMVAGMAAAQQAPHGGTPWAVPGKIQLEDFDDGGDGVAYHDTTVANEGGLYRAGESVDIFGRASAEGRLLVARVKAGEWLEYTVDVAEAGIYSAHIRLAMSGLGLPFTRK